MRNENLAFCPFCLDHGDRIILCEGLISGLPMIQCFATPRRKRTWYEAVCRSESCGRRCPAAAALYALLDEDSPDIPLKVRLMAREYRERAKQSLISETRS